MAVDVDADVYAHKRVNIFFPGEVPSLDGQCVSLVKWFLAEMTSVPYPQAARGHARHFGDTLVAQGHADQVATDQRRRGDIVVWKVGDYGHIGILLSSDRLFEQNVHIGGPPSRVVSDGTGSWRVYAARIGGLYESWRAQLLGVAPTFYRIRTYVEGGQMVIQDAPNWFSRCKKTMMQMRGRDLSRAEFLPYVGKDFLKFVEDVSDNAEADRWYQNGMLGDLARRDKWDQQIYTLQDQVKAAQAALTQANIELTDARKKVEELGDRPTAEQLASVTERLKTAEANAAEAKTKYDELASQTLKDQETGNSFLRWLGKILGKDK